MQAAPAAREDARIRSTTGKALADTGTVALTPARGSNSFSRAQAMRRIQNRGFTEVTGLRKDADGVWRGTGNRAGASVQVWLDFKGNVGRAGDARPVAGLAATAPGVGSPTAVTDGMAGNPPGTAARRATDLAVGVDTTGGRAERQPCRFAAIGLVKLKRTSAGGGTKAGMTVLTSTAGL